MKISRAIIAVAFAVVAAAGCNLSLHAKSLPPPGRSGSLFEVNGFWGLKYYRANLSVGIALGVGCEKSGPCKDMVVESSDQSIVEVTPAAIAQLESAGYGGENRPAASFVMIGKKAGTAVVVVRSHDGGNRRIAVTVLPPPSPSPVMVDRVAGGHRDAR